jgi:hypothetical protein
MPVALLNMLLFRQQRLRFFITQKVVKLDIDLNQVATLFVGLESLVK